MADQELTDLVLLATLANSDLFFVRDVSTGIDKQVTVSTMTTLFGGGNFLSHTDTPSVYTGAQNNFVKVNVAGTALEFIADPGFLTDITAELIGDLSDVTITSVGSGELLAFTGSEWENQTLVELGIAPATHTHVEADITDLQNYSLVGHTHVEANITDLQAYLLNINAESIDELSDVDTTTSTPISGDVLSFNGSLWVPSSGMAPGAHASTHISAGSDEIDGDRLDINFIPANYTRDTTPSEVTLVDELTAHLKGIDNALTGAGATDFLALTDTPAAYTGAASQFVKVNSTPNALEFAALVLGDLPAIDIDDLSDVTISSVVDGELLRFNGTVWINNTLAEAGIAAAGHTHVEADITDLQTYLLNITGEQFTDLSDTPANYTGAGLQFSRVNVGETDLEFVALSLSDLPAIAIDDLSDVDTFTTAPVSGDVLSFDGTDWVPVTGMVPGAHASTHVSGGTDVIDGDVLDITFIPANYTRDTSPSEVTSLVELTAHLKGIDNALSGGGGTFVGLSDTPGSFSGAGDQFVKVNSGATALVFVADPGFLQNINSEAIDDLSDVTITTVNTGELLAFTGALWENQTLTELSIATTSHAATHVSGGADEIDGDRIEIDFSPANYTPDTTPAEVTLTNELTAHLAGIDLELATVGTLPKWDRQQADQTALISTTSTTFVDVPGLTLTTKDLGGDQNGSYLIHFSASVSHASQKETIEFQLLVDGVVVTQSVTSLNFNDATLFLDTQFSWYEDPILNNKIIKVRWRQLRGTGSVGSRTASMTDRRLIVSGIPSVAVVV